jgi:hypothetical protein
MILLRNYANPERAITVNPPSDLRSRFRPHPRLAHSRCSSRIHLPRPFGDRPTPRPVSRVIIRSTRALAAVFEVLSVRRPVRIQRLCILAGGSRLVRAEESAYVLLLMRSAIQGYCGRAKRRKNE